MQFAVWLNVSAALKMPISRKAQYKAIIVDNWLTDIRPPLAGGVPTHHVSGRAGGATGPPSRARRLQGSPQEGGDGGPRAREGNGARGPIVEEEA